MAERTVGQRSVSLQDFHAKIAAENKAALAFGVKPEVKDEPMEPASSNVVLPPAWPVAVAEPPPRKLQYRYI